LASACKALPSESAPGRLVFSVQGVEGTPAVVLLSIPQGVPKSITLDGRLLEGEQSVSSGNLLWLRFTNTSSPQNLSLSF